MRRVEKKKLWCLVEFGPEGQLGKADCQQLRAESDHVYTELFTPVLTLEIAPVPLWSAPDQALTRTGSVFLTMLQVIKKTESRGTSCCYWQGCVSIGKDDILEWGRCFPEVSRHNCAKQEIFQNLFARHLPLILTPRPQAITKVAGNVALDTKCLVISK